MTFPACLALYGEMNNIVKVQGPKNLRQKTSIRATQTF